MKKLLFGLLLMAATISSFAQGIALRRDQNLADLLSVAQARTNLGLDELVVTQTNINNVTITTNLTVENITVFRGKVTFETNLTVNETIFINNSYVTNLTVENNTFLTTNYTQLSYVTNLYVTTNFTQISYVTNLFVTTNFVSQSYVTNLTVFETNLFNYTFTTNLTVFETNFVNNSYVTNQYVFETNFVNYSYNTNLFVENNYSETNYFITQITTNSTRFTRHTLAYTGVTNVWVDWDLGGSFELTLTNDCFIIMTNVPTVLDQVVNILFLNDSTGGYEVGFDYYVKWPGGTAPTVTTNASAWDVLSFIPGPFGTNEVAGVAQQAFE